MATGCELLPMGGFAVPNGEGSLSSWERLRVPVSPGEWKGEVLMSQRCFSVPHKAHLEATWIFPPIVRSADAFSWSSLWISVPSGVYQDL